MSRHLLLLALLTAVPARAGDGEVGISSYRAVLFSAQDYPGTDLDLKTPNTDITELGKVLEERYGFKVKTEPDASRATILDTLDELERTTGKGDALVVYFAGHGVFDEAQQRGYWLPADATLTSKSNWIANDDIAARMRAMNARHVLLLVDSCFAGALFREVGQAGPVPTPGDASAARRLAADRSRWVITSGGNEPVADKYRNGMSVFAYFLRKELAGASGRYVIPDTLFSRLREDVLNNARQKPQQGPFQGTGHENGQIVLLNGQGGDPGAASIDVLALARQADADHARRLKDAEAEARAEEQQDWEAVRRVATARTASSRKVLDAYVQKWGTGGRTVVADGETKWLAVGHGDEARALLAEWGDTGGERDNPAGIDWVRLEGGTFQMGSGDGYKDEKPVHAVRVPTFDIGRTEVTVRQYAACVDAGACTEPDTDGECNWGKAGREEHPVNCVDWPQAVAFVEWAGGRLPSEAEWEYAARGRGRDVKYPWGEAGASCRYAVMSDGGYGCGQNSTWQVCSKEAGNTPQGLCDMAGNVWEWVADGYHDSYRRAPIDGGAREVGSARVFRGGSWISTPAGVRVADRGRNDPSLRDDALGFRLSRSVP